MNRIKIDTKRVGCIMHDTSIVGLSIGVQNTKKSLRFEMEIF